jgi:hypothetical protein
MMLDLVGGDIGSVHGGARTREWEIGMCLDWHIQHRGLCGHVLEVEVQGSGLSTEGGIDQGYPYCLPAVHSPAQGPTMTMTSRHIWCCRTQACQLWSTCHSIMGQRPGAGGWASLEKERGCEGWQLRLGN